jgi:hypothetical protein
MRGPLGGPMLGRWGFKGGGYRRVGGDFAEGGGLTLRGPVGAPCGLLGLRW